MAGVGDPRDESRARGRSAEARELQQVISHFASVYEEAHDAFVRDFKANAVRLVRESDTSTSDIGLALGIPTATLEEWVEEDQQSLQDALRSDNADLADLREQLSRMRQENARLRSENVRLRLQFPTVRGDQ